MNVVKSRQMTLYVVIIQIMNRLFWIDCPRQSFGNWTLSLECYSLGER